MLRGFVREGAGDGARRLMAAGASVLALACTGSAALAAGAPGQDASASAVATPPGSASASVQQCVTAASQDERSAVFLAEMTALPASVRMAIQIDVQVRLPGEEAFHNVSGPGLGSWRVSEPGVKDYKYIRQVINLPAPGFYRALVHFRWLNAHNRLLKAAERHSARCEQPAPAPAQPPAAASKGSSQKPAADGAGEGA